MQTLISLTQTHGSGRRIGRREPFSGPRRPANERLRLRTGRPCLMGSAPGMVIAGLGLAMSLAGCKPAPTGFDEVPSSTTVTAGSKETMTVQPASSPAGLELMCRDVVSRMFGQEGDAVAFERLGEARASVSWRAPVDGGKLNFECRVEGDSVELFREDWSMSVNTKQAVASVEQEAR